MPTIRSDIGTIQATENTNSYHVLQYNYVSDILERRGPYRAAHLEGANKMASAGKLVMAGALAEPVDGALFIFRNCDKEEIDQFVRQDPYYENGCITSYAIRPYIVVAGDST
jgi:uncharacterized protein